jgi:AcrR family transcriptional regulator
MPDSAEKHEIAPPASRRERRKLEVRTRILQAAVALFQADGVANTTVAQICKRADVAHKTFFNHYPSKQHLLREIAEEFVDRLLTKIDDTRSQSGGTANKLTYFFDQVANETDDAGPMHRELVTEIIHVAHESGTDSEQARKLHGAFGLLVADGLQRGDVTLAHGRETLTEMILGAFYVLIFDWALLEDYPLRSRARAAAAFLGDALTTDNG